MQLKSIRTKLIFAFVPIVVIAAIVSGFLIGHVSRSTIDDLIQKQTGETATVLAGLVEEWIAGLQHRLFDIANSGSVQAMKPEGYRSYLRALVDSSDGLFEDMYVTNSTGDSWNRNGAIGNVSARGSYQDIFFLGKPFSMSNGEIGKESGKTVSFFACPIRGDRNETVGMLTAVINLEKMGRKLDTIHYAEGEFCFIVDGSGWIIGHSDNPDLVMKLNLLKADASGFKGLQPIGSGMQRGEAGDYEYTRPDGAGYRMFYRPIVGTPNWSLGIGIPLANLQKQSQRPIFFLYFTFGFLILLVALLSYFIGVGVAKPIKEVGSELKRFGELNLTRAVSKADDYLNRKDEVGQMTNALSKMVVAIRNAFGSIYGTVDEMNASSRQLAEIAQHQTTASQELARQAQKVENNVQNVSASIEEVTSGVEEVAASALGVSKIATEIMQESQSTSEAVQSGMQAVKEAIGSIRNAHTQTCETSTIAAEVASQTKKVGEIVDLISSISEQTNLLALNAAIEAARAGEAGRGFAVVADEIRKLAEESKSATSNITTILKGLSEGVRRVDTASNKTVDLVQKVNETGEEIGKQFSMITSNVEKINEMVNNLTATSEEQGASTQEMASAMDASAKAISEIKEQIEQIAKGVETQAHEAGKVSLSAQQLDELARNVGTEVRRFKI